ncbi:hypothetical protein ACA910_011065 [Epithemia clementina (nom. ined.)]
MIKPAVDHGNVTMEFFAILLFLSTLSITKAAGALSAVCPAFLSSLECSASKVQSTPASSFVSLFSAERRAHSRDPDESVFETNPERPRFSHADIQWILRPSRAATPDESKRFESSPLVPFLEFPMPEDTGKVVLESWIESGDGNAEIKKVGRFGITAMPGFLHPAIIEAIKTLLDENLSPPLYTAAIIYMVVEEKYRNRGIGELALEAIAYIHAQVGCGYTLLVSDDDGSGKLVAWYENHGFVQAPLLNAMTRVTSNQVTMIGPTSADPMPDAFKLKQDAEPPVDGK